MLLALPIGFLTSSLVDADVVDQVMQKQHLGVATCATSQCHGKSSVETGRNVQLNEYTQWIEGDRHSIAYRTLETEESERIARNLGIEDATTDDLCLDCHADNPPPGMRGSKFLISDGVGCEACHGGSEQWIETHTNKEATHARNLAQGMIATERPEVRAELCLSCHLGTEDKFATHRIMAAGHPRLSFELELFSANQPAHFTVDDDYVERKGRIPKHRLWLTGQLETLRETLDVSLQLLHQPGRLPDFSFFDCHSCHHPMSDLRWTPRRADGLEPGSLRLNLPSSLIVETALIGLGANELAEGLGSARRGLLRGAQAGPSTYGDSVDAYRAVLDEAAAEVAKPMDLDDLRQIRRALLSVAGDDRASDFAEAEQVYFGFESLCYALDEADSCAAGLDKLFATVADPDRFNGYGFANVARELASAF